ncbi:DNA mismatch repair protein MutS [Coraliomargarita parva]|uniref:DNA mismatch repair protein MutS n=1 Tax=Coraliomargarita parva TaxID=3014050 RepID=UPI0022B4B6C0|nr:DNA mismatch repair protein MutS [Coraliomargarita parva]
MAEKKLTPMMQQWHEIRAKLSDDTLLMFRLGDFYEIFLQDAEWGAKLLGITLTHRHGMPMAGIPYHAADTYMQKLLDQGVKIAICDQMETPKPGKLVKRELTRIITPGTRLADTQIDANRNHYLLALELDKKGLNAAWLDLTTGEFVLAREARPENLFAAFEGIDPREIIVPEAAATEWSKKTHEHGFNELYQHICAGRAVTSIPDYHFDLSSGAQSVMDALGVLNLEGFGLDRKHPALGAAGALVHYATETLCAKPENLRRLKEYSSEKTLLLDPATLRNLEIFKSAANTRQGSLIAAMDETVTAAGARLLERWLCAPELDVEEIQRRQNCVGEFVTAPGLSTELQTLLKGIRDIERILGRLQNRMRNPRELGGVRDTLNALPAIAATLLEFPDTPVAAIAERIYDFGPLCDTLDRGLADELPGKIDDGGTIRDGFDEELDHFRSLTRDSQKWLSEFELAEQERTGIKNLRIRYNGAFGYFIEVTKSNLALVPEDYIRKQTMKNAERFTTEVLKEREREILHAEENAIGREETLFNRLISEILEYADNLKITAEALAEIDVFIGWAVLAREWDYCKPELDHSDQLLIDQGRHPVVEQMMRNERLGLAGTHAFVPNDCRLSSSGKGEAAPQIALITGPNMAGKSTYIRQVALIVLMAQSGAWVPARSCRLGLVDRIFSRVGASDELARGNSTFMVEMNETANILNNATPRSLVILDEIGRGTSTYDGLSIAWAVIEHLHPKDASGARTLFATHYHELTQLAKTLNRLENYSVAVKEWNDEIIFVRQVIKGAADRSYGIQVARLAGLPSTVIDRAKTILERLEADDSSHNLLRKRMKKEKSGDDTRDEDEQLALF